MWGQATGRVSGMNFGRRSGTLRTSEWIACHPAHRSIDGMPDSHARYIRRDYFTIARTSDTLLSTLTATHLALASCLRQSQRASSRSTTTDPRARLRQRLARSTPRHTTRRSSSRSPSSPRHLLVAHHALCSAAHALCSAIHAPYSTAHAICPAAHAPCSACFTRSSARLDGLDGCRHTAGGSFRWCVRGCMRDLARQYSWRGENSYGRHPNDHCGGGPCVCSSAESYG